MAGGAGKGVGASAGEKAEGTGGRGLVGVGAEASGTGVIGTMGGGLPAIPVTNGRAVGVAGPAGVNRCMAVSPAKTTRAATIAVSVRKRYRAFMNATKGDSGSVLAWAGYREHVHGHPAKAGHRHPDKGCKRP
jgi:hypothetical protein